MVKPSTCWLPTVTVPTVIPLAPIPPLLLGCGSVYLHALAHINIIVALNKLSSDNSVSHKVEHLYIPRHEPQSYINRCWPGSSCPTAVSSLSIS